MKVKTTKGGTVTTFDHVKHFLGEPRQDDARPIIAVGFDGQADLWMVNMTSTVKEAIAELQEYYKKDWAGTGRVLPLQVYTPSTYDSIMCI